ncbi:MAG: response regulator [Gammaproteobacteria bacterium]|jgi:two-component system response regulator BaeR|nr:two-component system response regulator BaeR [Gammaproteobacteria bacterium]MBQ08378.1 two-component system response regulator BaeR [Gammaproteobacteria bacterium]MDP6146672.1 response regulator [Gammaproteobacteria bacterium]HJL79609.1 response regulator [Gammaproteobacteria bacterium]HJM09116.1 response regulator [Gammaproteobacteria bacterium]|tara:strand:+ start:18583 stop:19254 length:672 start_codon:yes stop_codon:yes gene_type:complete
MKHVLIVEDEKKLADILAEYLNKDQFKTTHFESGKGVVDWVKENQPNIILLDLMLPDVNGKDLCKQIRQFSSIPIIMVTAMIDEIDRLIGLELGADDYVCKPFSPKEVVARVKAVLRRSEADFNHGEIFDAFEVSDETYSIKLNQNRLDLTPVEFRLLKMFLQSPGRVFNRDQILDNIFEDGRIVLDRTVDTHVKNLRHKLKSAAPEHDYVRSIYGIGYSFEL